MRQSLSGLDANSWVTYASLRQSHGTTTGFWIVSHFYHTNTVQPNYHAVEQYTAMRWILLGWGSWHGRDLNLRHSRLSRCLWRCVILSDEGTTITNEHASVIIPGHPLRIHPSPLSIPASRHMSSQPIEL
jgi:hypothetical protein